MIFDWKQFGTKHQNAVSTGYICFFIKGFVIRHFTGDKWAWSVNAKYSNAKPLKHNYAASKEEAIEECEKEMIQALRDAKSEIESALEDVDRMRQARDRRRIER